MCMIRSAGADTTRLVLATLFVMMLRDPKRYTDLQKELDKALGKTVRKTPKNCAGPHTE